MNTEWVKSTEKLAQMLVSYLDMLEFKHISLYKSFLNLLTCPCNKQLIIVVSLLRHNYTSGL